MYMSFLRQCPRRHLLLHVDINKTIIQVDAAGGRTMENVLHSNAAANVMGYVDQTGAWVPLFGPTQQEKQQQQERKEENENSNDDNNSAVDVVDAIKNKKAGPNARHLLAYDTYVDRVYDKSEDMKQLPQAERDAVWKTISSARRNATGKFAMPGEVGYDYAHLVEHQRNALRRPRSSAVNPEEADSGSALSASLSSEYYCIIPGFFHLINTLSELDWPFTLIFRTFGTELPLVLKEWGEFVRGEHTCQPRGPVLQKMKNNYIKARTACMFRDRERSFLCYEPTELPAQFVDKLNRMETAMQKSESVARYLQELLGCSDVSLVTPAELHDHLLSYYTPSHRVGGLVDYYPFWAQSAEQRSGGKMYPIALSGEVANRHYYVFFDDNIFLGKSRSIVDVRDISTGASVEDPEQERKFCVPVNAYKAIVEPNYFVECLCDCLKRQQTTE